MDKTAFLTDDLHKRKSNNQYRILKEMTKIHGIEVQCEGRTLVNFCSNNYLGLADHPVLKEKAIEAIQEYGVGAAASRYVCGNFSYHSEVEEKIAQLTGFEAALLFNTGYQGNLTIASALLNRHSVIFIDKSCHNSLVNGAKLTGAKIVRYPHSDYGYLERSLEKFGDVRKMIMTESLFSMDGDIADLDRLIHLSEAQGALLYVDDAHTVGVMGERGMGLCAGKEGVDLALGTFGKGAGVFGAYVACSQKMRDYLVQFCPGVIYSTALPPALIGAIDAALDIIPTMTNEREALFENAEMLKETLQLMDCTVGPTNSHIIPIILGSEAKALMLESWLWQHGILAPAIRPPTVPPNQARVRLSLSTSHNQGHIQRLINALQSFKS